MAFLRLAWRNVLRNYRRSLITVFAISVGVAGLIYVQAHMNGENNQMIDNSTGLFSGHVQVHKKGFFDDPALNKRIKDTQIQHVISILQNESNVEASAARVEAGGLISTGDKSLGSSVIGIDPASEKNVTTLDKSVIEGKYLGESPSGQILLGYKAAEKLGIRVGDALIILTQAADGSIGAQRFELAGIFKTGMEELDDYTAVIHIKDAQELFSVGSDITGLAVKLKDRNDLPQTIKSLNMLESSDFEVHPWQKLLPTVYSALNLHSLFINFISTTVFVIIAIGIMNTISMSTLERNREFGIMLALGTTQNQMIRIVVYESALLGLLGILLGFILGGAITGYFALKGIDLTSYNEAITVMPGLSPIIHPQMDTTHFVFTGFWILLITVVVSLYPAWRVGNLEPVSAIRGIRAPVVGYLGAHTFWDKVSRSILPARFVFSHMAWRNITRNMGRSAITVLAIGIGLGSMIFFYSIMDGFFNQMINNATRYVVGDMRITTKEFHDNPSSNKMIDDKENIAKILSENKDIKSFAERVETEALLSTAEKSQNILLIGLHPEKEKEISAFDKVIKQGSYLSSKDRNGVMLGAQIAEKLKVTVGDKVIVMVQDSTGSLSSEALKVQGIIETGVDSIDKVLVIINLRTAQSLLSVNSVSTIFIELKDRKNIDMIAASINSKLGNGTPHVYTWEEVIPLIIQLLDFVQISLNIFLFVVFGVIILGIMNTILMGVFERIKEFGMMMALGTNRWQVVRLVLYELMFLGILGVIAGNIISLIVVSISYHTGFDLSFFSPGITTLEKVPGIETTIYPVFSLPAMVFPSVVIFVLSLLIGLYPAWKAASLEPVQAMRNI